MHVCSVMWMTYILAVQIASTLLLKCTCHGDHHQPNATPGDLLSMVIDLQMRTRVRTSRLPKGAVTQGHRRIVPMLVVIPIPERFQLKRGVYVSCIIRCLHKLSPLCYPARCGMVACSARVRGGPTFCNLVVHDIENFIPHLKTNATPALDRERASRCSSYMAAGGGCMWRTKKLLLATAVH
jgi:hypothetical protein